MSVDTTTLPGKVPRKSTLSMAASRDQLDPQMFKDWREPYDPANA